MHLKSVLYINMSLCLEQLLLLSRNWNTRSWQHSHHSFKAHVWDQLLCGTDLMSKRKERVIWEEMEIEFQCEAKSGCF